MAIRIKIIQEKIDTQIKAFNDKFMNIICININYNVSDAILKQLEYELMSALENWKGIDLTKKQSPKPYKTFREYFVVGKNWWDQRKTPILGSSFWGKILSHVKQVFYLKNIH